MWFFVMMTHLVRKWHAYVCDTREDMAESSVTGDSDVIAPYRFEPESLWSTSEENDSDDTNSQESFTERLEGSATKQNHRQDFEIFCFCSRFQDFDQISRFLKRFHANSFTDLHIFVEKFFCMHVYIV